MRCSGSAGGHAGTCETFDILEELRKMLVTWFCSKQIEFDALVCRKTCSTRATF